VRSWAIIVAGLAALLCGCSKPAPNSVTKANPDALELLELRYQANPGTVSPPEIAEELGYLTPLKLNCVGSTASGPTSIQAVVTGDTDFGSAFDGAVNGEQALRQGRVDVATLGTIFRDRALERGGIRLLFSDYQLYGEFTAGSYVLRNDFIRNNPKTARKFVEAVARALDWERTTPREQVVRRFQDLIAKRKRTEDASAIRFWLSSGVAGHSGLLTSKDFQIWLDWMVKDGELGTGQVHASDVFRNGLNPFAT